MNQIRPISETTESVTLNRSDFDALREELEDAADRIAVLEDCLLDAKPGLNKYLLTMDETMRIIDGDHRSRSGGKSAGMSVRELADRLGLHEVEIEEIENNTARDSFTRCRSEYGRGANKPCSGLSARSAACRHTLPRIPHVWPPVTSLMRQPVTELREATRHTGPKPFRQAARNVRSSAGREFRDVGCRSGVCRATPASSCPVSVLLVRRIDIDISIPPMPLRCHDQMLIVAMDENGLMS
jgi:hypothetical protein